jgi:hypothetical protein
MEMVKTHNGKLRAIGYEASTRILRVELDDGSAFEYANVREGVWRNFNSSASQWSYYRDNIEEEFTATRVSNKPASVSANGKNPLDDLFR